MNKEMKTVELSEEQIKDLKELLNMNFRSDYKEILYKLEYAEISLCMNPQINFGCNKCARIPEANKNYPGRTWIKPEIEEAGVGYDSYCMDFETKEQK